MTFRSPKARLIISAAHPKQFPKTHHQEVVFVGRSNVGKSSIINSLTHRKRLAYVGQRPGKTRLANFYELNDKLMFVDVPGYGFANRSKQEQKDYAFLMESYFQERKLDLMIVLVDIRRGMNEDDWMMVDLAEFLNIPYLVVLNKVDKLSRSKMLSMKQKVENELKQEVYLYSDRNTQYRDKLSARMQAILRS